MKELDVFIKKCNLIFTKPNQSRLPHDYSLDFDKSNCDVSISLLHLVSSFNKLYVSFKKEYEELEKLSLGKNIRFIKFSKFDDFDYWHNNYRWLDFSIDESTMAKHKDIQLRINEMNGEIKNYIIYDKNNREEVKLNNNIAKKYLDLFEKYSLFLDAYNYLKNRKFTAFLLDKSYGYISTSIDNNNSNLLDGLNKFKILLKITYFREEDFAQTKDFVELVINVGNNFGIDYDNSKLNLDGKDIEINKKNYDKILENIYIDKGYTVDRELERLYTKCLKSILILEKPKYFKPNPYFMLEATEAIRRDIPVGHERRRRRNRNN